MTLEDRVARLERRVDQLDRIEADIAGLRADFQDLRADLADLRTDFKGYRAENAIALGRILATLEAQQRQPLIVHWPWQRGESPR